ncbi:site-specific integrase [Pedobacter riviphilus]|uniref:Site-specific integrase n=1 Tax=Pedobacter riviphilus TaxID=2766984 RepID=A0ABX6TPA9_9SPHI|nr:site-specific integrase [Pedobacter riviphilus]QNR86740.1 site-specific integrase [Pedobacter riviphilus]
MSIKIKQNKLKNDRYSLSLDIYYQGVSKYENLKMFVYEKPKTTLEKEHNKRTLAIAEQIKAKRILEMQESHFNIHTGFKSQANFLDYFKKLVREKRTNEGNYGNWTSAYKHLIAYNNSEVLRFCDCDEVFIDGFKKYLREAKITKSGTNLSTNSAISYLNKLKAALSQAFVDRIILENPGKRVKGIKPEETNRQFLLEEELKTLATTECEYPLLKKAFLFSCLTGLRWSDINKLIWEEVIFSETEQQYSINFRQKKTKGLQYNPISFEAFKLLGARADNEERVFKGLKYSAWNNHLLQEWIWKDADIKKKITFHCARHTYATLLLTSGADIYTVSKLLGHQDLKTTEIYGKIINTQKVKVVNLLPTIGV